MKIIGATAFVRSVSLVAGICLCVAVVSSHAALYTGGDWKGQNFTIADGDILSGEYLNIGVLTLPSGVTASGLGNLLRLNAWQININGSLLGSQSQPGQLVLNSGSSIVLNGTLAYWAVIAINSESDIYVGDLAISDVNSSLRQTLVGSIDSGSAGGSISIIGRGGISETDGYYAGAAGNIKLSPITMNPLVIVDSPTLQQPMIQLATPLPAAGLLFCSGLGGLALLRRRNGQPG